MLNSPHLAPPAFPLPRLSEALDHESSDPFTVSPPDAQTFLHPAELYAMRDAIARADPGPVCQRNVQPPVPVTNLMSADEIRQQLAGIGVQHTPALNPQQLQA